MDDLYMIIIEEAKVYTKVPYKLIPYRVGLIDSITREGDFIYINTQLHIFCTDIIGDFVRPLNECLEYLSILNHEKE